LKIILLLAVVPLAAAPTYSIVNIGGVGGSLSEAFAISANGAVAGTAYDIHNNSRGFAYEANTQVYGSGTDFRGINSKGEVVGTRGGYATVWRDGSPQSLGALGGNASWGLGISEAGRITGAALRADGELHAFLSFNGQMLDVGTLGGSWSSGYAVNDAAQVAGYSLTKDGAFAAFRWDQQNGMRRLDGPNGSTDSRAFGINGAGAVAGSYRNSSGDFRAAMWDSDGTVVDIGSLGGGYSFGYGINDDGSVVGFSYDGLGRQRAFIWTGGMLFDLNSLVNDVDWSFTAAYAINAKGQIAGTGYYKGVSTAFRLDPNRSSSSDEPPLLGDELETISEVPEPALALPVLIGLGVLLYRRKRLLQTN
jgi:probable HAF family extracellular repeat protein